MFFLLSRKKRSHRVFQHAQFMITLEVTTMRGAAAPASFSLNLPSALLEQTRSPGVNASSQRVKCKRGGTLISRDEWGGVGVASRKLESAPFRDVAVDSGFVARRRCQTPGIGLGLAGTLTPYRGSGSSESFGLTLAQQSPSSRAHQAPFAVAFLHGAHGPGRSPIHWTFLRE